MGGLSWFKWNGKLHLVAERGSLADPVKGHCGIQPATTVTIEALDVDLDDAMVSRPCRTCLLEAATRDGAIEAEPMDFARERGVMPMDDEALQERKVTFG